MKIQKQTFISLPVIMLLIIFTLSCKEKDNTKGETKLETYTMEDFLKVPKIDAHAHINSKKPAYVELAREDNFKLLDISVDAEDYPSIEEQLSMKSELYKKYPDIVAFVTAFSIKGWDKPDWQEKTIVHLKNAFELGAVGVKVWKNIGMEARDKDGNLIMLDNPKFDKIFQFIKDQNKVLLNHVGEPKNCWLPLDEMTVDNDRGYFKDHPEYHMYLHPDMPSYEEQIAVRDRMLEKNPGLKYVGVHLASLEWSVDEIAKFLNRFPNAMVDLAARIGQVQYQSKNDRNKVRDFFIKYQDRILYGADFAQESDEYTDELKQWVHDDWLLQWKYFNTDEIINSDELGEEVQGLALPKNVIDKIYYANALKTFPNAWIEK